MYKLRKTSAFLQLRVSVKYKNSYNLWPFFFHLLFLSRPWVYGVYWASAKYLCVLIIRKGSRVSNFQNSTLIQCANESYHLLGISSVGGSDLVRRNKTRTGLRSWLGGSVWASSISVIPSDQISAE